MRSVILVCLLLSLAPAARAETLFFDELGDVPVMPALQELPDRTLVFDKPSGRIAQVTAIRNQAAPETSIEAFYRESLPQLGWQAQAKNVYIREGEKLTISPATEAGQGLVVFRLEPR